MIGVDLAEATRAALATLARPIAVVSVFSEGQALGMTATAVSEVSLDPPSMLVCVNKRSSLLPHLTPGAPFALSMLSDGHEDVSRACGGAVPAADRFAVGRWTLSDHEPPLLADALASFVLTVDKTLEHGSHVIIVGRIERVAHRADAGPLLYHSRGYERLRIPTA